MSFSEKLRTIRASRRMTLADIAAPLGVSRTTVSDWENGHQMPRMDRLPALARVLGVTQAELVDGDFPLPPLGEVDRLALAQKVWRAGVKGEATLPEQLWNDQNRLKVAEPLEYAELATNDTRAFIFEVADASMFPRFQPGECFLVEPGTEADIEDDVLVRLKDGQVMLRRLLSRRGGYRFGTYASTDTGFFPAEAVSWVYYVVHAVPRRRVKPLT